MSSSEKSDVFNRALLAISKIEAAEKSVHHTFVNKKAFGSTWFNVWNSYVMERKFMPTLAFVAVLLLTGGTSIAAESSLPGDSLYPLKININEQIQALTATTPEAKAKFASDATGMRLKEAAILSSRGQLNNDAKQIIQQQIAKNAGEVKNQVASLVATNNLKAAQEVTVNFESSLKAHALILEKLSTDQASTTLQSASTSTIGSLLATVKDEIATTTVARVGFAAEEFKADAYNREKIEADIANVETDLLKVQGLVSDSKVGTSTASTSQLYFTEVAKYIEIAKNSFNRTVYPEALTALQSAEQVLSDVEALINADINSSSDSDLKKVVVQAVSAAKPDNINVSADSTAVPITGSVEGAATSTSATSTSPAI